MNTYIDKVISYINLHLFDVLGAILLILLGWSLIKLLTSFTRKILDKKKVDTAVVSFITSALSIALKVCLVIMTLEMIGVKTTSLLAVVGAAGLAIGLALQGTLSNLAGGVLLIILHPFGIGDFIEALGFSGTVKKISLFTTSLITADRKTIIIANGGLASGNIINYSLEPIRRVDLLFGIGYGDDLKLAKQTLESLLSNHPKVLADPAPSVSLAALADSSVNFNVRPFVKKEDYWEVYSDLHEQVKLTFDEKGISIPFPQQDIHLFKES